MIVGVAWSAALALGTMLFGSWACRARLEPGPVVRERAIERCQRSLLETLPAHDQPVFGNPRVRRMRGDRYVVRVTLEGGGSTRQLECHLADRGERLEVLGMSIAHW